MATKRRDKRSDHGGNRLRDRRRRRTVNEVWAAVMASQVGQRAVACPCGSCRNRVLNTAMVLWGRPTRGRSLIDQPTFEGMDPADVVALKLLVDESMSPVDPSHTSVENRLLAIKKARGL